MKSGDTFLIVDGSDDHLWMIISDTDQDPENVVVVRFLSYQPRLDQACVLNAGSHPFIKHPTCVQYPDARIARNSTLEELKLSRKIVIKAPLSPALLKLIRDKSIDGDIITECIAMLGAQGLVEYP